MIYTHLVMNDSLLRIRLFRKVAAFICGLSIMAFELSGIRILTPYYGSSIAVTTAIITVVLGGLATGGLLGGYLADKAPNDLLLGRIFIYASISVLFAVLGQVYLPLFISLHIQSVSLSALVSSVILFGPATIFFGAVLPLLIRLEAYELTSLGFLAGRVSAFSTIGSLLGTVFTGYFLFGLLGTFNIMISLSALTGILGIIILFSDNIRKFAIYSLIFSIILIFTSLYLQKKVIFKNSKEIETAYGRYWVVEGTEPLNGRKIRYLTTSVNIKQSSVYLDEPKDSFDPFSKLHDKFYGHQRSTLQYVNFFDMAHTLLPEVNRAMLIGGAGLVYPVAYISQSPGSTLDVVEIDPEMFKLARDYFNYTDNKNISLIVADGRQFANQTTDNFYDVIFIDAFNSGPQVPWQLITAEAMLQYSRILKDQGLLVINFIASLKGSSAALIKGLVSTARLVFKDVDVYAVYSAQDKYKVQNIVLFAHKNYSELSANVKEKYIRQFSNHRVDLSGYQGNEYFSDQTSVIDLISPVSFSRGE